MSSAIASSVSAHLQVPSTAGKIAKKQYYVYSRLQDTCRWTARLSRAFCCFFPSFALPQPALGERSECCWGELTEGSAPRKESNQAHRKRGSQHRVRNWKGLLQLPAPASPLLLEHGDERRRRRLFPDTRRPRFLLARCREKHPHGHRHRCAWRRDSRHEERRGVRQGRGRWQPCPESGTDLSLFWDLSSLFPWGVSARGMVFWKHLSGIWRLNAFGNPVYS